jgi:DNA (cytosine-5)-methyltransferase 1
MNTLAGYYIKKVGSHRGAPRIWLEGSQTLKGGFVPGQRFDVTVNGQTIVLQANKDGSRVVSSRQKGDRTLPIIDINSAELLAMFDGMAAVRVVVAPDAIYILPLASEIRKKERFQRIKTKLENGDPLLMGSLSHGAGTLSNAVHTGLKRVGVNVALAFANEIREELIEQAAAHNSAWNDKTIPIAAPLQEFAQDDRALELIPRVDIMEMGLPCSAASKAGLAKRGAGIPEAHPEVGHLVASALIVLNKTQAAVILMENVPDYATTASAYILRSQLRDMGYRVHEAVLSSKDFGSLENRERWCLVATTEGIDFTFEQLVPTVTIVRTLKEVLEDIPPDDPRWRSFDYLKAKSVRDKERGNGFAMQTLTPDSTSVPVLRKGYHKSGSTDPLLKHPTDPNLLRQLTANEHALIKGVPPALVDGIAESIAHQILGQGIVFSPFEAVGGRIGESLIKQFREKADQIEAVAAVGGKEAARRKQRVSG